MKPALLLIFFLVSNVQLYAQDSTVKPKAYWVVKLAGGPQPDGYPGFLLLPAIEKRSGNYGMQLQVGVLFPQSYLLQDTIDHQILKGNSYWFSVRAEVRKYVILKNKPRADRYTYVGVELFANVFKTARKGEYLVPGADPYTDAYEDAFVLDKKMLGVGFTFGVQRYIYKRLMLGLHTGLGVKFKYTTAEFNKDDSAQITYRHGDVWNYADRVGFSFAFAMPLNIYIGYKL